MNKMENFKHLLEHVKLFMDGHKKLTVILVTLLTSRFGIPPEVVQAVMFYLVGQAGVDMVKAAKGTK